MENIQINLQTPVYGYKTLNVVDMTECNGELLIKLEDKECYDIYEGQELIFKRYVYEDNQIHFILTDYVTVNSEDENHIIHTTIPVNQRTALFGGIENVKFVSGYTENNEIFGYHIIKCRENHNIFPQDVSNQEIYIKDYEGNLLGTYKDLFVPLKRADWPATSADCITFVETQESCGKNFKKIDFFKYDFLPEKISRDTIIISGFNEDISDKMAYFEKKFNPFYFYYIETDEEGNLTEFNEYGEPVKHCRLYGDSWWDGVKNSETNERKIINSGDTKTEFGVYSAYWDVNVGLSTPVNETTLGSYDSFNTSFVHDIEQSLIPEIIDMERVKYIPMIYGGSNNNAWYVWNLARDIEGGGIEFIENGRTVYTTSLFDENKNGKEVSVYEKMDINTTPIKLFFDSLVTDNQTIRVLYSIEEKEGYYYNGEMYSDDLTIATSITLNFHFRKRSEIDTSDSEIEVKQRKQNTLLTSGNVYHDGWYINPDSADTIWWNGMDYNGNVFSHSTFNSFLKEYGEVSDLLGYLNFTDNDVFYKKKKVSQSFVRLTFYNSTDPIEQKLLYHSTIFLDATNLYGKYVKQLLFIEENNIDVSKENQNAIVVFCSANTISDRVDTQIIATNEYDKTKSAEGFNLYLFAEDTNFNVDENGEKTIYMKVEFNHAGNGKTMPMIMWPKFYWNSDKKNEDETKGGYEYTDVYQPLTVDNFIKSLYIPIKLTYINGNYAYYIPDAYKNENGNISLVLFEPKLDFIEDEDEK